MTKHEPQSRWALKFRLILTESALLPSVTKLRRLCFYTCLSFCSQGGVCLSACWDTTPPRSTPAPWEASLLKHTPHSPGSTPLGSTPPRKHTPPGRHPLRETATTADGTHPTGMHSCYLCELVTNFLSNWPDESNVGISCRRKYCKWNHHAKKWWLAVELVVRPKWYILNENFRFVWSVI